MPAWNGLNLLVFIICFVILVLVLLKVVDHL